MSECATWAKLIKIAAWIIICYTHVLGDSDREVIVMLSTRLAELRESIKSDTHMSAEGLYFDAKLIHKKFFLSYYKKLTLCISGCLIFRPDCFHSQLSVCFNRPGLLLPDFTPQPRSSSGANACVDIPN